MVCAVKTAEAPWQKASLELEQWLLSSYASRKCPCLVHPLGPDLLNSQGTALMAMQLAPGSNAADALHATWDLHNIPPPAEIEQQLRYIAVSGAAIVPCIAALCCDLVSGHHIGCAASRRACCSGRHEVGGFPSTVCNAKLAIMWKLRIGGTH